MVSLNDPNWKIATLKGIINSLHPLAAVETEAALKLHEYQSKALFAQHAYKLIIAG